MAQFNPFLRAEYRTDSKGGVRTIEHPHNVENIVFQTRGEPLDAFEDDLADQLMTVFGGGAQELSDVVQGLNTAGSRARDGAEWTERSFQDQMAESAAALFATSQEVAG